MSAIADAGQTAPEPPHARRITMIWAVATVILVPLVIFVIGPHVPPGQASEQAHDQHDVNVTLSALATPIVLLVWVYFAYAAVVFRQRGDAIVDGPHIEGNHRIQLSWLAATTTVVLGLAIYGTIGLLNTGAAGAGGGEGPSPLAKPADVKNALEVQVLGQQWLWTFRYPGYGGVETDSLALPAGRVIELHVTSLDVAHSFWAIELGVKADAIPGNDNVAYVKPVQVRSIQVRCAEVCGLWHGEMSTAAHVMTPANFAAWIAQQQRQKAAVTKQLPPYSHIYYPAPIRRAS